MLRCTANILQAAEEFLSARILQIRRKPYTLDVTLEKVSLGL